MFRKIKISPKRITFLIGLVLFFCLFFNLAFAASPQIGAITPNSGSGLTNIQQVFSTTYSDPDGWQNIQYVYFLINTSTSTSNCPYFKYDQNTNLLYVRNDTNTAWLGGFAPGSANVIENKYAKLDCALTSVTGSETTMTVNWAVTIKPLFIGTKNTYLYVKDDTNASAGYTKVGTWAIPNQPPVITSINPASGISNPNEAVIFTTVLSDPDTWQHIQYVYFIVNTSASGTNSFEGYYNQNTNLLYLRNDANSAWLGGFAPGSSNVIENSYCILDCSQTTVTGSGNDMTVIWKVTFKPIFAGAKNTYLYVKDDTNAYVGWTKVGTWNIANQAPQAVSITPASGETNPNEAVNFTTIGSDPDGWQQVKYIYFLVNTSTSTSKCFYAYYDQINNKLYLRSDTGTWLGGFAPGSVNVIENSYCKLDCSLTTVSGAGNNLTINWNAAFKSPFGGLKNTYLNVYDRPGLYTGLTKLGTWTVKNQPPQAVSITPASGEANPNEAVNFTTVGSDPDGWQQVKYIYFLVNTSTSTSKCFYAYYDSSSDKLYLRNDANSAWLGGFAPGSTNVIENSYCKLNCSLTAGSGAGNNLTINWNVVFKSIFTGNKNTYLRVYDVANLYTAWTKLGTWIVKNQLPTVDSITPASGTGNPDTAINFTTVNSDPDGWGNIQTVYFLINTSINGAKGFYSYYDKDSDKLYLRNDANSAWLGGFAPGSTNVIENSYSKLDCSQTVVTGLENSLVIKWAVTFKSTFTGQKNSYIKVNDRAGATSNWVTAGVWSINLDSIAPTGSIKINNDDAQTEIVAVTLNLTAQDNSGGTGLNKMKFSNDNVVWSEPETYATTKDWTLTAGNGTKTVYVKYKDVIGNWSEAFSDTIELLNIPKERIYVYVNGQRVAMEENGKKFFYHNDHLGGANVVTDENGQQVKHIEYQPYGDTKLEEGSLTVKNKFTGKELDESTGLYNYSARQYAPKIGRFISADPIDYSDAGIKIAGGKDLQTFLANPQNLNRYTYCLNNPIKYTDPDGLSTALMPGSKIPSNRKEGWSKNSRIYKELIKKGEAVRELNWNGNIFSKDVYEKMTKELISLRKEADLRNEKFNIIAHSWGAVAAVEILNATNLEVDNLITIGSPAQGNLLKPSGVHQWTNIISPFDPIGWGSLGSDSRQVATISIHANDFNNPFISQIITNIISNNKTNLKENADNEK